MANNSRDVSLVIQAKDEATKVVDSITSALQEITRAAKDFRKSGTGTDSVLTSIGQELGRLNQAVQGSNAFDRLAQGSQRAENAVSRLQTELQQTAAENQRLADESRKAADDVQRLGARAEEAARDLDRQKAATRELKDQQTQLRAEVRKTEQAQTRLSGAEQRTSERLEKLSGTVIQAQQRYNRLAQEMAQTENPSRRLQTSYEAAGRSLERQLGVLLKSQQAQAANRTELAATGQRLTELRGRLATVEQAYQAQLAVQERFKNNLTESRAQARGAQQNLNALQKAVEGNQRAFNRTGQALQRANGELREVRQVAGEADAAINRMGTNIRTNLLRALREAESQLQNFRNAQAFGQGGLQRMAQTGQAGSPEFQQLAAQTRVAKQAVQEQQVVIARLRQDLRAAGTDVQALAAAQQRYQQATAAVTARTREATAALTQKGRAAGRAAQEMNNGAESNRRFAATLALIQRNARQTLSFTQRLRSEVIALTMSYAGLYGVIAGGRGVTNAYMTLEAVQNRLGAVFQQNTRRVGQEIDWLMAQADRLGISFDVLSDAYAKFAVATNAANFEAEATRRIFLSVAEAGRVNKLSMEQMNGIFLALEQMISKGKIVSEELRRQLGDRLPGAFSIMADAMGVTTAELDRMMGAGELFSNQDNMLRFATELDKRFGAQLPASLESFTAALGRFQNEIFKAQLSAGEAGFMAGLSSVLETLTEYFRSAEGQQFFVSLGTAAGKFLQVLALIPQNFDALVTLTAVFIGQRLGRYLIALVQDLTAMRAQLAASAVAQTSLNAAQATGAVRARGFTAALVAMRAALAANLVLLRASVASSLAFARSLFTARGAALAVAAVMRTLRLILATMGGPIGLLVTGLSILFARWLTSASAAQKATAELNRQMQLLRTSFAEAADSTKTLQTALDQITLTQVEANLAKLRKGVRDVMKDINNIITQDAMRSGGFFGLRGRLADLEPFREAFRQIDHDLKAGVIPNVQAFREEIDRIAQNNPALKDLAISILEVVDGTEDGKTSLAALTDQYQQQADILTLKLKPGTDAAREAMERLGIAAAEATVREATAAERLDEAYQKLAEALRDPVENKRLRDVEQFAEILREFEGLNKDAWDSSELARYLTLVEKVQAALNRINREAADSRVTGDLVNRIIGVESGGDPNARNALSSATGLGQFIESTWLEMFRKYFPDRAEGMSREAILALRTDAKISREMVEAYARENAQVLQQAGQAVTDASLYLSHFLGPGGALRILEAAPDTPVDQLLSPEQIAANRGALGGRTAGEVQEWAARRIGISKEELAIQERLLELERERAETQLKFNEYLDDANADRRFQMEQARLEEAEQGRQAAINAAIRDAERRALRDNLSLTRAQREEIEATTGALWDQQNAARLAAEERRKVEERVNSLMQHRRDLMQAIEFAEGRGDQQAAERLRGQLADINLQLEGALDAAEAFWTAMGGPEAEAALIALQNVRNSLEDVGHSFLMTAEQIDQAAANMGADAFMGFAEALADGENAIQSLGNAFRAFAADFLKMIARMIMQQVIFNALQAAGFGGGVGAGVGRLFHTGGVVGSGGPSRSISAGWFASAARYHTGGIAGLRPNEVPAILERGEEVLTRDDPRHMANGGGAGAAPMDVKIINTIDAGSFVSEGMNTTPGQKAVMNFIRANRGQIKDLLGG